MFHSCTRPLATLATLTALAAGSASADLTDISYKLHAGYSTQYLWRGLDVGDDLVETGFNLGTEWNGLNLSAGAWYASFETAEENVDELDLYAEVAKDFGFLTASVGYIAYLYPQTNSDTYHEIYFGVAHDFGFVAASLKYFWDIEGDNDGYTELALTRSFTLNPCLTLNLESNVGYLVEPGKATAWVNKASLDWAFTEHAKLSPYIAVSLALSDDAHTAYVDNDDELVGGMLLSVTF